MTISNIQRRKGRNFAKVLAEIAAKAPDADLKSGVYALANKARLRYGGNLEQKKGEVVEAVRLGAATVEDMIRETPFNKIELYELLKDLLNEQQIRVSYLQTNNTGPKVAHYFPQSSE